MNLQSLLATALFVTSVTSFYAQQNLGVGTWRDYLPYSGNNKVVEYRGDIYSASEFGVLRVDVDENSMQTLSKVNGLSDVAIQAMDANDDFLLIGYQNGNIDLIDENGVTNIPDLKNANITGNKSVNDILFIGDETYLATGFGLLLIDTDKGEIKETIYIADKGYPVVVKEIELYGDSVFALIDDGIMKAYVDDPNFENYTGWELDTANITGFQNFRTLSSGANRLMMVMDGDVFNTDSVYEYIAGNWTHISELETQTYNDLLIEVGSLTVANFDAIKQFDNDYVQTEIIFDYGGGAVPNPLALIRFQEVLWIGDQNFGLVKSEGQWASEVFVNNSPKGSTSARMVATSQGDVWVAGGLMASNYQNTFNSIGLYHQNAAGEWNNINRLNSPIMEGTFDYETISANSGGSVVYAGSGGRGLLKIVNGVATELYTDTNSTLEGDGYVSVLGSTFDRNGNLWVSNSGTQTALHCLTPNGEWYAHTINQQVNRLLYGELIQAYQGYLWVLLPYNNGGILVYDFNNTPSNPDDDRYKVLNGSAGNGGMHSTDVYSIAEDVNGYIWVGTATGVATFYSPNYVFDEGVNYDAQRVIVEVDGYNQYLLTTETVTAIAIDGGNRKWFGTTSGGIYLMSEDGSEELLHFTAENSPLVSNRISSLAFNPDNGELVIGTDKGMQAYKSSATGVDPVMSDVLAYPNPVRSDYDGMIAIKGLAYKSQVRITDISGQLVFSTVSNGGQAVWNGEDMNGNKVSFGVYLVFAVDEAGQEKEVSKIMFVR